ncbi:MULTISPECIES: ParA family protein [Bifidobacterium]|uniref:Chromosome partitioning protein ParA n=2 Tax=Bifidobacterium TaxID=1678 RepID=A0A261FP34_9BIFI|nr:MULTISPECIES: ParA family protein [Bifidobacterium]OZG60733.1 chromosome partitioning protein ParA [Bifidobacterium lemurum]OZG69631.1 chromosome partitioning protein ParA [Bifidobacterium eulemuris]QOL32255.1 ParA family protein [Bifidobacterium eulemuris]QOL35215.1 ParA family protein [Bifidobacterium lemurum]
MRIITIANAKGGVAKTTSALYLAHAHALRRPDMPVVVLDADPQSSASEWALMASEAGEIWEAVTVEPANLSTLRRLRDRLSDRPGLAIVDAPPQGKLLEEALRVADFVIVPTSDSPLDLQQAWATMASIPASIPAAVLVVRAEASTTACADTLAALDAAGTPRFDTIVRKRQEIKKSMGHRPTRLHEYTDVLAELLDAMEGDER